MIEERFYTHLGSPLQTRALRTSASLPTTQSTPVLSVPKTSDEHASGMFSTGWHPDGANWDVAKPKYRRTWLIDNSREYPRWSVGFLHNGDCLLIQIQRLKKHPPGHAIESLSGCYALREWPTTRPAHSRALEEAVA